MKCEYNYKSERKPCQFLVILILMFLAFGDSIAAAQETRGRANASQPEATLSVNEQFLNSFLTAMFDNLQEPSMPLTIGGATSSAECPSEIRLKREAAGVRTSVHFEQGKITGPLAFAGAYNSTLLGCVAFTGWADSELTMEFSRERHAVLARFHLRDIHLNNTPAMLNGPLLKMVQNAIDNRYNPIELFTLEQLSTRAPIKPAGGALRIEATDVRPEITPTQLTLHITYRFVRG
ncbi:MAG TPA: hypothetical protein VN696_04040 [Pyrinomonadaceae bacterium]|nr:hypothetical protein [Pyrinomonadaceae bacterium]